MAFCHKHGKGFVVYVLRFLLMLCSSWSCVSGQKKPPFCDPPQSKSPMSFLWLIRRDPPSYFFGTIHVPYTRVWDFIPENTKRAFEYSEQVYFELDLTDPFTISALTNCQLLPVGENLSDVLPKELYRRLKRHLDYVRIKMPSWLTADQRGQGLYADYLFNAITGNWERKRPVWVMLMVNSLTESDIKSRGVPVLDLYLAQEAERMNKETGAVERVDEQCVPLNGLNFSQVMFALNQTLSQHEKVRLGQSQPPYTTDDLIKHYNCGDLNAVIFNQDTAQVPLLLLRDNGTAGGSTTDDEGRTARQIDDYFRRELIYNRNRRMGQRVVELLHTYPNKSFFFAFGAGHFLGEHTVLDIVREQGYLVDHVSSYHKLRPPKRRAQQQRPPTVPEFSPLRDFSSNQNIANAVLDDDVLQHSQRNRHTSRFHLSTESPFYLSHFTFGWRSVDISSGQKTHFPNSRSWHYHGGGPSNKHHHSPPLSFTSTYQHQPVFRSRHPITPVPTSFQPRPRNFNDLWVRLDSVPSKSTTKQHLPTEAPTEAAVSMQQSLRVWYGVPSNAELKSSSSYVVLFLVISVYLIR